MPYSETSYDYENTGLEMLFSVCGETSPLALYIKAALQLQVINFMDVTTLLCSITAVAAEAKCWTTDV